MPGQSCVRNGRVSVFVGLLAVCMTGMHAPGQTPPAHDPAELLAPPPEPAPRDPLAGPTQATAQDASSQLTLIRRDPAGNIQRLDLVPEEAAVAALPLTDEERTRCRAIIADRAVAVDRLIYDNIPLLLRIQGVREEGLTQDRVRAMQELHRQMPDLRQRREYRRALAAAMSADNARLFDRLMGDYIRAIVDQSSEDAKAQGKQDEKFHHMQAETYRWVGQEIRASLDRRAAAGEAQVQRLMEIIQPMPAQEAKIRSLISAFTQETQGKATSEQRLALIRGILSEVNDEQRKRLFEDLYADARGTSPTILPAPTTPTSSPPATTPAPEASGPR